MKSSIAAVGGQPDPNLGEHGSSSEPEGAPSLPEDDQAAEEAYLNEGGNQASSEPQRLGPNRPTRIIGLLYLPSRPSPAALSMHSCTFSVKASPRGGFIDTFEINDQEGRVVQAWSAHAPSPIAGLPMACARPVKLEFQAEA